MIRRSESRYVTSKSPLPRLVDGLNCSGSWGTSNGGSCDKFPVVFTVVFSNMILTVQVPIENVTIISVRLSQGYEMGLVHGLVGRTQT